MKVNEKNNTYLPGGKYYYCYDADHYGKCTIVEEDPESKMVTVLVDDNKIYHLPTSYVFKTETDLKMYVIRLRQDPAFELVESLKESYEETAKFCKVRRRVFERYCSITFSNVSILRCRAIFCRMTSSYYIDFDLNGFTQKDLNKVLLRQETPVEVDIEDSRINVEVEISAYGIWHINITHSSRQFGKISCILNQQERQNFISVINTYLELNDYSFHFSNIVEYTERYQKRFMDNPFASDEIDPLYDLLSQK